MVKDNILLIGADGVGNASVKGTGDNMRVPQVDSTYAAGFGDTIQDSDRAFAAVREPIVHFLTYGVSNDITEKWFVINDPDTEEADPALDRSVQEVLSKLQFKKHLTDAITQARIYKKSLLVAGFTDAKNVDQLKKPLSKGAELVQFAVYPSTVGIEKTKEWVVQETDLDPNSLRYGLPKIYKLDRGNGNYLYVHYTRVVELDNIQDILSSIWDDVACGRNIRWGVAQWMYRTGNGFPVIGFPAGVTKAQLQEWFDSGYFANLMSRTGIFIAQNSTQENTGMTFDFKGPNGQSLDPTPFFKTNIEQVAIATGIPQAKLVGAQAGAVTGSEVNMQDYYKLVSREQSKLEEVIRWVLDRLAESGQIKLIKPTSTGTDNEQVAFLKRTVKRLMKRDYRHKSTGKYLVDWNSAFELSELDEATIANLKEDANSKKLSYMSKDEVRAEHDPPLDPLPKGAGEWKDAPEFGGEQFLVSTKGGSNKPNAKSTEKPTDKANNSNDPSSKTN